MPAPAESEHAVHSRRIQELNDEFRRTFKGGSVVVTPGVSALSKPERDAVVQKVRDFADFTEDNDPHGEHDFGNFEHAGRKLFWKIDYYSPGMQGGSEDPSDPAATTRVLTIMHAEEY